MADTKYGEILGVHIVGNRACDMIAELVAVRDLEGGYQELARIIHPHPTISEAVMESARAVDGLGDPRLAPAQSQADGPGDLTTRPRLPYSYLAAERISRLFADASLAQPEWRPILLGGLFAASVATRGNGSGRCAGMREVERRADAIGSSRSAGPIPGLRTRCMRCESPPTRKRSAGRSPSPRPPFARPSPAAVI